MARMEFNEDGPGVGVFPAGPGRTLRRVLFVLIVLIMALHWPGGAAEAGGVRVATFNVMNYLCMDRRIDGRFMPGYPKPESEKAAVREVLRSVAADVVCLQEIGSKPFLEELRQDLQREGLDYPHVAWLEAADPMRHVAVLSRLPFREVVPYAEINFRYLGREESVKRGLLEVGFDSPAGGWSLFTMHLKSPLTEDAADPGAEERRTAEARAVRDVILKRVGLTNPLYLVAGDLNAASDSRALSALRTRGERVISVMIPAADSRGETWTHRYLRADRYERLDYVLVSPLLARGVVGEVGHVHDGLQSLAGSDHRLVWLDLDFERVRGPETETPAGVEPAGVAEKKSE